MKTLSQTFLLIIVLTMTGCGSMQTAYRSTAAESYKLAKNDSGIVYGVFGSDNPTGYKVKDACEAIKNVDPRCSKPEKYVVTFGMVGFGFFSASATVIALVEQDSPLLNKMSPKNARTGDSDVTYAKFRANQGRFADVLEIASLNGQGEKKCYWSGMPRAGGTVCPAYNWDYRKDLRSWDTSNGSLSVSKD